MSLLIGILTFILVITSLFLVMVVLMQRAKTDGGMGSALGGGSMESTFGAETGNVLSGATIKASVVFFVLSFGLYLAHLYQAKHVDAMDSSLPTVIAPALVPLPSPAVGAPITLPSTQPTTTPAPVETKQP